jgi:hypothetical protein
VLKLRALEQLVNEDCAVACAPLGA